MRSAQLLQITHRYLHVRLGHVKACWHATQDTVTKLSPSCSSFSAPYSVCVCGFYGGLRGTTLSPWASDHTAPLWELSNTAGTSTPPSPVPNPPSPLFPRIAPQTLAGSFDNVVVNSKRGKISIFICLEDSDSLPPSHHPQLPLISIKRLSHVPSSLCMLQMRHNWYRHDWGGGKRRNLGDWSTVTTYSSFCVAFEVQLQQKTQTKQKKGFSLCFFSTSCHTKRVSVLCNKRHLNV